MGRSERRERREVGRELRFVSQRHLRHDREHESLALEPRGVLVEQGLAAEAEGFERGSRDGAVGGYDGIVGHLDEDVALLDVAGGDASAARVGKTADGDAVELHPFLLHPRQVRALAVVQENPRCAGVILLLNRRLFGRGLWLLRAAGLWGRRIAGGRLTLLLHRSEGFELRARSMS